MATQLQQNDSTIVMDGVIVAIRGGKLVIGNQFARQVAGFVAGLCPVMELSHRSLLQAGDLNGLGPASAGHEEGDGIISCRRKQRWAHSMWHTRRGEPVGECQYTLGVVAGGQRLRRVGRGRTR